MSSLILSLLLATPAPGVLTEPAPVMAQARRRDIGVGDPLRRPLLNALRPSVQQDLGGQPVRFLVTRLHVQGEWAFCAGEIQQPNGRPIDFSRTRYASALENGVFDGPGMFGLLRRSGQDWQVVTFVVGPTDVGYLDWPAAHGAPADLFE